MTWDQYVDERVRMLARARDRADFMAEVNEIESTIKDEGLNQDARKWVWTQVRERYEKAPKLVIKEGTASERLYDLHAVASGMLAAAQARSSASSSSASSSSASSSSASSSSASSTTPRKR